MNLSFTPINQELFLAKYWQKKPFIFRKAISPFALSLTADELAGLALEDDIESRIVIFNAKKNTWQLKRGPFDEQDFARLPATHWTLLVQGVDRVIPEINQLLDYFKFIPQWRVDDIMISFAVSGGSVGPHYDNYDVFLFQAQGQRKWSLTTQHCVETNYLENTDLRIMKDFLVEEDYVLEEGDILYLPAHVGHYGVALTDNCMTYSIGYRSYPLQELWESLGENLIYKQLGAELYNDPHWQSNTNSAEIPDDAWREAKKLLAKVLDDEEFIQNWFASFMTSLDSSAEQLFFLSEEKKITKEKFKKKINTFTGFRHNLVTRWAYFVEKKTTTLSLYINGKQWPVNNISDDLIKILASQREIGSDELAVYLNTPDVIDFLYQLWHSNCIEILE